MMNLRRSILSLEEISEEELRDHSLRNVALFVQMFQFERLARDDVWMKAPKLHHTIGSLIHNQNEIENEFRHNVIKSGLGRLLDFTY